MSLPAGDTGSTHGGYRQTLSKAPGKQHSRHEASCLRDAQQTWV